MKKKKIINLKEIINVHFWVHDFYSFIGHIHYDKKYIMSGACDQNIYRIAHIEYVHNPIKIKKKKVRKHALLSSYYIQCITHCNLYCSEDKI